MTQMTRMITDLICVHLCHPCHLCHLWLNMHGGEREVVAEHPAAPLAVLEKAPHPPHTCCSFESICASASRPFRRCWPRFLM